MLREALITIGLIFILTIIGCSSGGNPVENQTYMDKYNMVPETLLSEGEIMDPGNSSLLGIWQVSFDLEKLEAEIEPYRDLSQHFLVTHLIFPPPVINVISYDPVTQIASVEVTATNSTIYTGHDVRAIVYTDNFGNLLLNEDGWTELFDLPDEGEPINPFRAYSKDKPNREFVPQDTQTEYFEIFLASGDSEDIIWAFEASYPGNCEEPYMIANYEQQGELCNNAGSSCFITVDVYDWQNDVDFVIFDCMFGDFGQTINLVNTSGITWSGTYQLDEAVMPGTYTANITAVSHNANMEPVWLHFQVDLVVTNCSSFALNWGGYSKDYACAITIDHDDNIIVFGRCQADFDLDPSMWGIDYETNVSADSVYLSKFDQNGNYLWGHTWGTSGGLIQSASYELRTYEVAVDASNCIYTVGQFGSFPCPGGPFPWDFDPDPDDSVLEFSNKNSRDIFVSKFLPDGDFLWVRTWGGGENANHERMSDFAFDIDVDNFGIYIVGCFEGDTDFDPGKEIWEVDTHIPNGRWDIFLTSLDLNGNYRWAQTWGSNINYQPIINYDPGQEGTFNLKHESAYGVACDGSGHVYVAGDFWGQNVDFDPDPMATDWLSASLNQDPIAGGSDIFISEFDSNGDYIQAISIGDDDLNDRAYDVVTDASNLYITGFRTVSSSYIYSNHDIYICSLTPNLLTQWEYQWGTADISSIGIKISESGYGIDLDSSGNVYITGFFQSLCNLNPQLFPADEHIADGPTDPFMISFDSNGNYLWGKSWGGPVDDYGFDIAVSDADLVHVCGEFMDHADLDPCDTIDMRQGNGDMESYYIQSVNTDCN